MRTATLELMIGLFAVALADRLKESDDWIDLFDQLPSPEALRTALAPLAPSFVLDGDGPRFAQDLAELSGEIWPADALFLDSPGDNTLKNGADLFAKRDRFPILSRKAAAVALYALQAYAPSGGAGHRTSLRGGGPLTTLVVPESAKGAPLTLWRRIAANLPLLTGDKRPPADHGIVFPWLRPTRVSTDGRKTEQGPEAHWLQHYFGMPRRIRLVFEPNEARRPCALTGDVDAVVVTGFRSEPWGVSYGVWRHPLSPYYVANEVPLPVHAQNGRVGYRDWAAYLFGPTRAEQAINFANLFREQKHARLAAMGFVTDSMKILDWVESEAPLFVLPNNDAQARMAKFARDRLAEGADLAARALRSAVSDALGVDTKKTLASAAYEQFWIDTEEAFFNCLNEAFKLLGGMDGATPLSIVREVDFDALATRWLENSLRRTAFAIFDETVQVDRLTELSLKDPGDNGDRKSLVAMIIDARRQLGSTLFGRGKIGAQLFAALDLPTPEPTSKRKAAEGAVA